MMRMIDLEFGIVNNLISFLYEVKSPSAILSTGDHEYPIPDNPHRIPIETGYLRYIAGYGSIRFHHG